MDSYYSGQLLHNGQLQLLHNRHMLHNGQLIQWIVASQRTVDTVASQRTVDTVDI